MNTGPAELSNPATCRVVVVDDHAIMRDGLCAILNSEPNVEVVGTANDGKSAIQVVGQLLPDIVLMDLSMPRTNGSEAISVIKRRYPDVKVIELLASLRSVSAGHSYLSPAICDRVMSGYAQASPSSGRPQAPTWEVLSSREREVLKLVAEGYKTREIAEYLSLSEKTVEKHRANMMRKLDLHGVSAVTTYAIENGLLSQ
jgi:DNA-binding NarL/FixJ family response regulator